MNVRERENERERGGGEILKMTFPVKRVIRPISGYQRKIMSQIEYEQRLVDFKKNEEIQRSQRSSGQQFL